LIEERYGISYTMDNIPYDEGHVGPDPTKNPDALFDMLGRGEVAGVFQVEGAGMRRLMMEMKPRRFDHIVAAISLYRPGPMENIPEYIRRMHSAIYENKDIVEYHTPALEPILNDTYGILVYQEQIIRIAANLAGYEPGEADMIRKAVAKKKKDLMGKHQAQFTEGAIARGFSREVCDAIWGDIEFFARYGFPKGHAASYGKITCQTAYLKSHYPVEYLTAMLSVERDNTEKVRRYFAEAKNLGIDVAPPDVNRSQLDFTIEEDGERPLIRFGLGAIKNAGAAALSLIIAEREANGVYKDIANLCERVDLRRVGKRPLEFMIKGRVLDLWGTPEQLMEALDRIVSDSGRTHEAAAAGQMSLFGGGMATTMKMDIQLLKPLAELDKIEHKQLLEWEKEALGVHVSEHPLERPLAQLQPHTNTTIAEIDLNTNGRQVRIAGMISQLRTLTTKKGDPMAFGTLEDLESKIDVVFFPRTWLACRDEVAVDQVMLVTGKVQSKGDDVNIIVDSVQTKVIIGQAAGSPNMSEPFMPPPPVDTMPLPPLETPPHAMIADPVVTRQYSASPQAAPPPPPNFDDDSEAKPVEKPVFGNNNGRTPSNGNGRPKNGGYQNGRHKIVVEIKPVGNWKNACRQSLKLADKFEGQDTISLRLAGQNYTMDFPNNHTQFCTELVNQLERLPGILRVYTL
jgi:DNA polymerase-3 subunit alpha